MNNTIAHEMYNNHVKESLLSGTPVQYSMKDFLPNKQNKIANKVKVKQHTEIKITLDEMKNDLERTIKVMEEQLELDKQSNKSWSNPQTTHVALQAYKIMLCKITGTEYVYEPL